VLILSVEREVEAEPPGARCKTPENRGPNSTSPEAEFTPVDFHVKGKPQYVYRFL
jgi:hypothetical protein